MENNNDETEILKFIKLYLESGLNIEIYNNYLNTKPQLSETAKKRHQKLLDSGPLISHLTQKEVDWSIESNDTALDTLLQLFPMFAKLDPNLSESNWEKITRFLYNDGTRYRS